MINKFASRVAAAALGLALAGCSSYSLPSFLGGVEKPKPAELEANPALMAVSQAWTSRIGEVLFPLSIGVAGSTLAIASSDGTVAMVDAATGRDLWRGTAGGAIAAGAGTDGKTVAVITRANELVALSAGREIWRQKLPAVGYTAPFVAGGRVFTLTADRAVSGYDGQSGRKLWTQQRAGEPLVLRHPGVMLAVGDTLVVGLSGRLTGLDPTTGLVRWEAPLASPRGINDVERLVDLVGGVSRVGDVVCARAFQASVGCVNAARGSILWTKPANGSEGLSGDKDLIFGTEADGKVQAWQRDSGERAWNNDKFLHRGLTAPVAAGRTVIFGDSMGYVHFLQRDDGSLRTRVATDGTAIASAPVIAGNTLVVVTRGGTVYGFVPQ